LLSSIVVALVLCAVTLCVVDITNEDEPSGAEKWFASSVFQIKLRAQRPQRPSVFTTTDDDLDRASTMYQQMCSFCHGASRGKTAPFAKSLSPRPPQFVIQPSGSPTWMDAYVIQHGIRWTGMPSFQGLSEADVWHLALYVEGRSQPRE
jgi:mono/diheme cytochrome c family protein